MSRIFISHSNEPRNKLWTRAFCAWLDNEVGRDTYFVDYRHIRLGLGWDAELLRSIRQCESVVLLLSRCWFDSRECLRELYRALDTGKQIVPVLLEPGLFDAAAKLGLTALQMCDLARDQAADLVVSIEDDTTGSRIDVRFDAAEAHKLRDLLRRNELDATAFPWPPPGQLKRPPYPGLQPLTEPDAGVFYGRTVEIQHVIEQARRLSETADARTLVIQGDSGVGKSSFLRAGILPRLQRDNDRFVVLPVLRPATGLMDGEAGLVAGLVAFSQQSGSPLAADAVRARLAAPGASLPQLLQRLEQDTRRSDAAARTIVLPIDQAEELFAPAVQPQWTRFAALAAGLLQPTDDAAAAAAPRCLLLLTIRSDHLHRLHGHALFEQSKLDYYVLRPMAASNYGDVIQGPARRMRESDRRIEIEPALVERLTADAQGADALPLLALTMYRLHEAALGAKRSTITLPDYEALARDGGVVQWAVDQAFAQPQRAPAVPASRVAQAAAFREIFPLIASVDAASGQPKRLIAPRQAWPPGSPADHVVTRLVEQHLLLQTTDGAEPPRLLVEVAHEAVLRQWPQFQTWLSESRVGVSLLESVQRHAAEWQRAGREKSALVHRGSRLAAALALRNDRYFAKVLQPSELAYLSACRRRQTMDRLVRAVPVALFLPLLPSGWWAHANGLDLWSLFATVPYLAEDLAGSVLSTTTPRVLTIAAPSQPYEFGCKPGRDDTLEGGCPPNSSAVRAVPLDAVCELGESEVTYYQYDYFVWSTRRVDPDWPYPGSDGLRWNRPVVMVSMDDARAYANWLSKRSRSHTWRLPNELEWEYAARDTPQAGPYPWGAEPPEGRANCRSCNGDHLPTPMSVRSFAPNRHGLYDMAGNVAEWTEPAPDVAEGENMAVMRGGAWYQRAAFQRVVRRDPVGQEHVSEGLGFRVCRVPRPQRR